VAAEGNDLEPPGDGVEGTDGLRATRATSNWLSSITSSSSLMRPDPPTTT
jgi:hypothetical protein